MSEPVTVRLRTREDLKAFVCRVAVKLGRNENHVWLEVERSSETGRALLQVLGVPLEALDLPSAKGRGAPRKADRTFNRLVEVERHRRSTTGDGVPLAQAIERALPKLRAQERDPALTASAVRMALARNPHILAEHYFEGLRPGETEIVFETRF